VVLIVLSALLEDSENSCALEEVTAAEDPRDICDLVCEELVITGTGDIAVVGVNVRPNVGGGGVPV